MGDGDERRMRRGTSLELAELRQHQATNTPTRDQAKNPVVILFGGGWQKASSRFP